MSINEIPAGRIKEANRISNALYTSKSYEYYTPKGIIDRTLKLFEYTIDLDPCSNSIEHPNIPADNHFTEADDGLMHPWHGRIFCNPPYGREVKDWVYKFISEYNGGNMTEGLLLIASRTDTKAFHLMSGHPCCLIKGRLRFSNLPNQAPFPSAIFYVGPNGDKFFEYFKDLGSIWIDYSKTTGYDGTTQRILDINRPLSQVMGRMTSNVTTIDRKSLYKIKNPEDRKLVDRLTSELGPYKRPKKPVLPNLNDEIEQLKNNPEVMKELWELEENNKHKNKKMLDSLLGFA